MDFVEGQLSSIKNSLILNVQKYLETGVFENRTNTAYVNAYSKVLEIADMDENAKHLYEYYKNTIKNYTTKTVYKDIMSRRGPDLLKNFSRRWENHKILVYWMQKIFYYLDRYFLKNSALPNLFLAGVQIFKDEIFQNLKNPLRLAVLDQIASERAGNSVDRDIIKNTLLCFVQLGTDKPIINKVKNNDEDKLVWVASPVITVYKSDFEAHFMDETSRFYKDKSRRWIETMSCPEYLKEVNRAFNDEENRLNYYLDPSSRTELLKILIEELVDANAKIAAEMPGTGCEEMLKNDKRGELKLMFSIFRKKESTFIHMTQRLTVHIESKGLVIVSDPKLQEDPVEFTKKLLEFKADIDKMVEMSFENHSSFQRCRDMAFQNFMNKSPYSAQFIASYCDHEMKKGLKGVSEDETEQRLNALIKLFVCLHDRDVFIRYYTRFLAKRLLDELSVSDEAEANMISKLRVECGHNIVSKISNMVQDKSLSEGLMKEFQNLMHKGSPEGIALNVRVLRNGCWPEQSPEPCNMPDELKRCFKRFEDFYLNKHQGRNLTILPIYGSLEVGTTYCKKPFICIINPYQACFLLLFNQNPSYSVAQLKEITRLSDNTLKSNLIPFFNPKSKLLIKQSSGKTINDGEEIKINPDFNSSTIKVTFLPKKVKKTEVVNKEDDKALENERKFILDSVIVRIAKGRKTIKHPELMSEVMRQVTHFRPQPPMVKAQIESLIQREFLKRDDTDKSLYIYLP